MSSVNDFIDENKDRFLEELSELLSIPSVSTDSTKKEDIRKAAEFYAQQLTNAGIATVEIMETPGNPIVYGEWLEAGEDAPTVLVYGHYDVQPPDPLDLWETEPFVPTLRDGKLYARGASDDKGQSYIHVKSIESLLAVDGKINANVKFIFEGEEEIGSPNLVPFLKKHTEKLACDMVLISDTSMFAKNTPSITYGLRGLAYMEVEVVGPNKDLHSGVYGGAVANPANVLAEMIAKLKNENGVVLIDGFYDDVRALTPPEREAYAALPFSEEEYKNVLGIEEVSGEVGYSTLERASARPSLDVNGLWSGYQGEGAKTVLPSKANAKISMRLVPDQNPHDIAQKFKAFVESIAPKSVTVRVTEHHGGLPAITDLNYYGMKAAAEAFETIYGSSPLFTREGGSIPIVADFKTILNANSILMGFGLNSDQIHSPNEHFHVNDFYRGIKTSAHFFKCLPSYQTGS